MTQKWKFDETRYSGMTGTDDYGRTTHQYNDSDGMTLREWYMGQALANTGLCTGTATEWQLRAWFGNQGGITREQIVAKQAGTLADAMLAERAK